MLVNESNFSTYNALSSREMKTTTQKALTRWWDTQLKALSLNAQRDSDGMLANVSVETLGQDFLWENLISEIAWGPDDEITTITLGDLAATRSEETDFVQFEVQPSKVEKLLTATDDGLLKGNKLLRPIELVRIPKSDAEIIGGGRHRTVALLTIAKVVYGWEQFRIPVQMFYPQSRSEVAQYIMASNGSRSMTQTEKSMVKAAAKNLGLSVFRPAEEFFQQAKSVTTVTALKDMTRMLGVALFAETQVDRDTTSNTLGDMFHAAFTKFVRELNSQFGRGTDQVLLVQTDEGQIFEGVARRLSDYIVTNWETIKEESKEIKKKRDGSIVTDDNGQPVYTLNIARHVKPNAAEAAAEVLLEAVGDQLRSVKERLEAEKLEAKQEKEAGKAATKLQREISTIDQMIEMMGSSLPQEALAQMQQQKAAIQQQIAELQQGTGAHQPIADEVPPVNRDKLNELLS